METTKTVIAGVIVEKRMYEDGDIHLRWSDAIVQVVRYAEFDTTWYMRVIWPPRCDLKTLQIFQEILNAAAKYMREKESERCQT